MALNMYMYIPGIKYAYSKVILHYIFTFPGTCIHVFNGA